MPNKRKFNYYKIHSVLLAVLAVPTLLIMMTMCTMAMSYWLGAPENNLAKEIAGRLNEPFLAKSYVLVLLFIFLLIPYLFNCMRSSVSKAELDDVLRRNYEKGCELDALKAKYLKLIEKEGQK